MEQDRYQQNEKVFVIGLLSLVTSLSLFALTFYVMPNLLFGWQFSIPGFIISVVEWLQYAYSFTSKGASTFVFSIIFLLALLFAVIAYYCSNKIDNQIYSSEFQSKKQPRSINIYSNNDGLWLTLKILFFILLILGAGALFEWAIYTSPQQAQFGTNNAI